MTRPPAPPLRLAGLHLLVLWSFAVAQPLFDLLGKNGEFFGARGSTRWDVILFALAVALIAPAVLLALEAMLPRSARFPVHLVVVAALVGAFALEVIGGASESGTVLALVAGLVGVAAAMLYAWQPGARLVLTVLAPAPLLFLALFLGHSDASRLTLSGTPIAYAAAGHPRASAIVVVFDELPTNSLLDRRGVVDPVRFPHFTALQRHSDWFANESVVSEGTLHGVPSLLTGRYPRPEELPVYDDHPRNLFTLLGGGDAQLHVVETETHLCPPKLCAPSGNSLGARMGSLFADTAIVYLHTLLPDDLAHGIPSVSDSWEDFWHNGRGSSDPKDRFERFLPTIAPTSRPALWYLHLLLPHSPWRYLPSGLQYTLRPAPGWSSAEVWTKNQAAVDQYWQRHLLQLGYADRLLGTLVARLRSAGLYDGSLLVVTADEGLSFRAGEKRRPASDVNLPDIAYVPLFVKLPHEQRGRVIRTPTQSVDVLPTIAGALGVRLPWGVDGQNALSPQYRARKVDVAKDRGKHLIVPSVELLARRQQALRRQLSLLGSDEPLSTLYAVGPDRGLLGHSIEGGRRVTKLDAIDRSSPLLQISGRITGARSVVVVAKGRVVAVVPVADGQFWALVPRKALNHAVPRVYAVH